MMRPLLFILTLMVVTGSISCSDNEQEETPFCSTDNPAMLVQINDTTQLRFNSVDFVERENNLGIMNAFELTNECIPIGSLNLVFERILGEQELIPNQTGQNRMPGEIIYFEINEDELLGTFNLFEDEPNQLIINQLEDDLIRGSITATFVWEESAQRIITLPDTLRFDQVPFRAIRFEPAN